MKLLTKEQQNSWKNAKVWYISQKKKKKKKKIEKEYAKDKKYRKAEDHCRYTREYSGAAHSIKKCT